jgi:hypothetical protein
LLHTWALLRRALWEFSADRPTSLKLGLHTVMTVTTSYDQLQIAIFLEFRGVFAHSLFSRRFAGARGAYTRSHETWSLCLPTPHAYVSWLSAMFRLCSSMF